MQSFSPRVPFGTGLATIFAQAGGLPADAWQKATGNQSIGAGLVFLGASIVAGILCIWLAGRVVAGKDATFGRALLVWLGWLVGSIAIALCAALGLVLAMRSWGDNAILIGLAGAGLLVLMVLLGVPMAVFQIGVLRGLGFLLINVIVGGIAQIGLQYVLLGASSFTPSTTAWQDLGARLRPAPAAPSTPTADLLEKRQALTRRQEALEIRRRHLPPGDPEALREYQREVQAYQAEVEQLQAEAAARLARP